MQSIFVVAAVKPEVVSVNLLYVIVPAVVEVQIWGPRNCKNARGPLFVLGAPNRLSGPYPDFSQRSGYVYGVG